MRRLLFVSLFFLLTGSAFAQCSESAEKWNVILAPSLGLRAWKDTGGRHILSTGDTPVHLQGNQSLLALVDSWGCDNYSGTMSFADVPKTKTWLDARLDRKGVCFETTEAYPDTLAAGACVAVDSAGNGACVLIGSGLPFGYVPPMQMGGLYSLLYVAEGVGGTWQIVGTPLVLPGGPIPMGVPVNFSVSLSGDVLTGAVSLQGVSSVVAEPVQVNLAGRIGFQVVHNPNLLCSPHRGPQLVNLK